MKEELNARCEAFLAEHEKLSHEFKLGSRLMVCLGALLVNMDGLSVDAQSVKESKALLKSATHAFSSFRGTGMPAIITKLAVKNDAKDWMQKAAEAYKVLRQEGFPPSESLALGAFHITKHIKNAQQLSRRAMELYSDMRQSSPLRISSQDACYCLMQACYLPDRVVDVCSPVLKGVLPSASVRLASQALLLCGEDPLPYAERTASLYLKLKAKKLSPSACSPILAPLALLCDDEDEAVSEIEELNGLLRTRRGFTNFAIGKAARLCVCAALVSFMRLAAAENATMHDRLRDITQFTLSLTLLSEAARAASAASGSASC